MGTLGDLKARLRRQLEDTNAAAYLWSDAELADDLAAAYRDYARRFPRLATVAFNGSPSTTTFALPADARTVVGVQAPDGTAIPSRGVLLPEFGAAQSWAQVGATLVLQEGTEAGQVRVTYRGLYPYPAADGDPSGLPDEGEDIAVLGAAVYALQRRHIADAKRRGGSNPTTGRGTGMAAALLAAREALNAALGRSRAARGLVMQGDGPQAQ